MIASVAALPTSNVSAIDLSMSCGVVRRASCTPDTAHDANAIHGSDDGRASKQAIVSVPTKHAKTNFDRVAIEAPIVATIIDGASHATDASSTSDRAIAEHIRSSANKSHPSAAATYRRRGARPDANKQTRIAKTRGVTFADCLDVDRARRALADRLRRVERHALHGLLRAPRGTIRSTDLSAAACLVLRWPSVDLFACRHRRTLLSSVEPARVSH